MKTYRYVLEECDCGKRVIHYLIDSPAGGIDTWKHRHFDGAYGRRCLQTFEEVEV